MRNQDSQLIRIIAFSSSVGDGAIFGGVGFWYILSESAREVKIPCPGDDAIERVGTLGFHGQRFPAERKEMGLRAGGTATTLFFGLGKIKFPQGDLGALIGTADRPLINKRRPRRPNLI